MTVMRRAVTMLAGLGALFLVPAAAQAADYQIYRDATCFANSQCGLDFPNIPFGKKVTLVNFSCYVRFPTTTSMISTQLVLVNNSDGSRAMAISPSNPVHSFVKVGGENQTLYTVNENIRVVGHGGQHFKTYAQVQNDSDGTVGTVRQLSCHISGVVN